MKTIKIVTVFLLSLAMIVSFSSCGGDKSQPEGGDLALSTEKDSASYALGIAIGSNVKRNGMEEVNMEQFAAAFQAVLAGDSATLMDAQAADQFLQGFFQKLYQKKLDENLKAGQKFLEENKQREGIVETPSGLQYEVLKEGDGEKPEADSKVRVHYHGTLIDGTVFDSSVERGEPAEFKLNQVIRGWREALQLMPVGSKWKIYVPTELGYGRNVRPGSKIEPNAALIFEVELLSILEETAEEGENEKQ